MTAKTTDLRKARRALRRKGYRAYIPALVSRRPTLKRGIKRRVTLLMRCVLVEAPANKIIHGLWLHDVLSVPYVSGYFANSDGGLAFVPNEQVQRVVDVVANLRMELRAAAAAKRLRPGQIVKMKNGHMKGNAAKIVWLRGNRAKIEAMVFGSMRVVEVKSSQLEAA